MEDRLAVFVTMLVGGTPLQHYEALLAGLLGKLLRKLDSDRMPTGGDRLKLEEKLVRVANQCPEVFARKFSIGDCDASPNFPLHIICSAGCSLEAVSAVHDAYPPAIRERDDQELLPIHKAVGCPVTPSDVIHYLTQAYPESLARTNASGAFTRQITPLHAACSSFKPGMEENKLKSLSIRRILDLLKACPGAALVEEDNPAGQFPLAKLIDKESGEKTPPELIEAFMDAAPFSSTMIFKPVHISEHHTTPLSYLLSRTGTPARSVRAILKGCPNSFNTGGWGRLSLERKLLVVEVFVGFTFDLKPAYVTDYPLHAIVLCPLSPNDFKEFITHYKSELYRPDDKGRFPLHIAAASERVRFERISRIVEADPRAASFIDPVSGLYPLLRVASRKNARHDTAVLEHLDSLYRLLRVDPDEIIKGVTSPRCTLVCSPENRMDSNRV